METCAATPVIQSASALVFSDEKDGCIMLGDVGKRERFAGAHAARLRKWFDGQGAMHHPEAGALMTRERMWHAISLLQQNTLADTALADAIILACPIDTNRFLPFGAVDLLTVFGDRMGDQARAHLLEIVKAHVVNVIDVRFGCPRVNNFSAMSTAFLYLASNILDFYPWRHPLGDSAVGYSRERLREVARNALYALAYASEHEPLIAEWNSSTYVVFTLHALEKIVAFSGCEEAAGIARTISNRVWVETLRRHHWELGVQCGPYARAYRADLLQQCTELDILLTYLGLSRHGEIEELFTLKTGTDLPPCKPSRGTESQQAWANTAWFTLTQFHVPQHLLDERKQPAFPRRYNAAIRWEPFGLISSEAQGTADRTPMGHPATYLSVQGNAYPGGQGVAVHELHRQWAWGYRSAHTIPMHTFPIHFHYARNWPVQGLADVRNVFCGIVFCSTREEWRFAADGLRSEPHLNQEGAVQVAETDRMLSFQAAPYPENTYYKTSEISVNSFVPLHGGWPTVRFQGECLTEPVSREVPGKGELEIIDGPFRYTLGLSNPTGVVRISRWGNLLRLSAVLYEGPARQFSSSELQQLSAAGFLRLDEISNA